MKEIIGLKKFRSWVSTKIEGVDNVLFPSLITKSMLPTDTFELKNGEIVNVSIAGIHDADAIMEIQEACYEGGAPWGRLAVVNEIRNKRNAFFLMVHCQDQPIAFIGMSMRINSVHVTNIATMPAFQGQGIATRLIEISAAIAKKLNRDKITLEVRISNERAKNLYRHIGFTDHYIKRNYYHDNGEDAIDMVYHINDNEMDQINEYG